MTRSLRRSRRAPKKNSDYSVGDVVQINRTGVDLEGRLAQFLSEGTSPNPRWLVKFDGQPYKDEEMYERSFGNLISAADEDEDVGDLPPVSQKRGSKPSGNGNRTTGGSNKGSGTSSEEAETGEDPEKDTNITVSDKTLHSDEGSNTGSDTSSNAESSSRGGRSSRVSAREARSKRRQAKIDEDIPPGQVTGGKMLEQVSMNNPKKRQRGEADGEVVKVKLLTGTLYLYRGSQRRAEFVRRV